MARDRVRLLCLMLFGLSGCALRVEVAPNTPHGDVIVERKAFFLWGLTPTRTCAVTVACPRKLPLVLMIVTHATTGEDG